MRLLEEMKAEVQESVASNLSLIVRIGEFIRRNPEIGYREYKAVELLTAELGSNGYLVTKNLCGLPTAFKAILPGKGEGPVVGILAEYDALPGLGHACGHNLSAAAVIGAAIALCRFREKLPGSVNVFGTPAEEGVVENAGGKVVMLEEFKCLDAAMTLHALDVSTVVCNSFNREALEIGFFGKAANAGSLDDSSKAVNALDAVMLFWQGLNCIRPNLRDNARVFGIITEGGISPNTVPARASTRLQIRAADEVYFQELVEKVKRAARGVALALGARTKIRKYANTYTAMLNNESLAEAFRNNLVGLGEQVDEVGRSGVATDMGNVSRVAPAIHPFIKIAPRGTPWHSKEAAAAASSEMAYGAISRGAKALAMTVLDLMFRPELVKQVRDDFRRATTGH